MVGERRRRAVMVDAELAEAVKAVASKYGMSVTSYMRSLLSSAIDAESRGIYAPAAITRYIVLRVLERLGVAPVPLELLAVSGRDEARRVGERVGSMLRSLGVEGLELLAVLAESIPGATLEGGQLVIVDTGAEWVDRVMGYVEGLAEAFGFEVNVRRGTLVVRHRGG